MINIQTQKLTSQWTNKQYTQYAVRSCLRILFVIFSSFCSHLVIDCNNRVASPGGLLGNVSSEIWQHHHWFYFRRWEAGITGKMSPSFLTSIIKRNHSQHFPPAHLDRVKMEYSEYIIIIYRQSKSEKELINNWLTI